MAGVADRPAAAPRTTSTHRSSFHNRTDVPAPLPPNAYVDRALSEVRRCEATDELSCYATDYSGYVREAALARCVELSRTDLLPIIVGRLNDWVPQVRHAARTALMTLLPVVPAHQLIATLPAIRHLLHAGRADHAEWVRRYEEALLQYATVDDIMAAARSGDIRVARACFHLLQAYRLVEPDELVRLFLGYRDDIVVALMAVQLCDEMPADKRIPLQLTALRSHFGAVRTSALRALLATDADVSKRDIAITALFDVQSSARSLAIAFLSANGFDVRAHYRQVLGDAKCPTPQRRIALVALASIGSGDDTGLVQAHSQSTHPAIRLAALAAWARLAPDAKDQVAAAALHDPSPRIRKFALHLTRKHGAYLPFAMIRSVLHTPSDRPLLLLFAQSNKWNWLECIAAIAEVSAGNAALRESLSAQLEAWCRRAGSSYEQPSDEQKGYLASRPVLARLEGLLEGKRHLIDTLLAEIQ